jgi:hypothetical protein
MFFFVADGRSEIGESLIDDADDDDDDYFALPGAATARNHWNLLSPSVEADSSLKQNIYRPPSSLHIPPLPISAPADRGRRSQTLFVSLSITLELVCGNQSHAATIGSSFSPNSKNTTNWASAPASRLAYCW